MTRFRVAGYFFISKRAILNCGFDSAFFRTSSSDSSRCPIWWSSGTWGIRHRRPLASPLLCCRPLQPVLRLRHQPEDVGVPHQLHQRSLLSITYLSEGRLGFYIKVDRRSNARSLSLPMCTRTTNWKLTDDLTWIDRSFSASASLRSIYRSVIVTSALTFLVLLLGIIIRLYEAGKATKIWCKKIKKRLVAID